ncbi:hypothetical protein BH23GEM7_BH23GEM7_03920 [soil metagenome]
MKEAVLITDGEQRAALALVRSLGRAGYRPYVCSTRTRSLAGASRYARGQEAVADPLRDPACFVAGVRESVERWNTRVILPVSEASLLAILAARESLPGVCIPFPAAESFRRISDKALLLATAREVGIRVPDQRVVASRAEARELAGEVLDFPVVLKPSRSVAESNGRRIKLEVGYAADRAQLAERLEALPEAAYPVLLQQRIVGPGVGIFLLLWEGETLGIFSHRRLREKPPSGGVSVYRESIPADPGLVERSRALLERFDWQGVAMIEYKLDAATGTPHLMEVNGRFWGSLQLAVDAGVDFPVLLVEAGLGRAPRPVTDYRAGVRSRWWWGDVDHLLARLRRSRAQLALPPEAPGRWRAVRDFVRLWRPGDRNEIFRIQDPFPLLRESIDWFARR